MPIIHVVCYKIIENYKFLPKDEVQRFSKVNRNIYKPPVPDRIKDIVRKNFTREIEFYEFCKRRMYMQYAALNLPETP